MRKRIALLVLTASLTGASLYGTTDAATKKESAKSMGYLGYFHQLHVKKMSMTCTTCHSAETRDILFLRKDRVMPAAMPGPADRSICLGCHQAPSKPTWYGPSAR
jgi:hypothetical protein